MAAAPAALVVRGLVGGGVAVAAGDHRGVGGLAREEARFPLRQKICLLDRRLQPALASRTASPLI